MGDKKTRVIIYSTKECPFCKLAKEFLKDKKINFKDIDVGENKKARNEMVKKSGQMSVPVIEIDGKIIVGFDKEKIEKLLKKNKKKNET